MIHVVLVGYYGHGNLGDEAILQSICQQWKRLFQDLSLTVVGARDCRDTCAAYGFPELAVLENPGTPLPCGRIHRAVRNADLVVIGGGGLLNDIPLRNFFSYGAPSWFARLSRSKSMGYGLGVGPVESRMGRTLLRYTCRSLNRLTVRDSDSLELVNRVTGREWGIDLASDPSVLLEFSEAPLPNPLSQSGGSLKVGLFPRRLPARLLGAQMSEQHVLRAWRNLIEALVDELDARVFVVPMSKDDEDYCGAICVMSDQKGEVTSLSTPRQPSELHQIMRSVDLVVGMRLHSLIFSMLAHTPYIGISYQPKVASFLRDTGTHKYAVPMTSFTDTAYVTRLIRDLINDRAEVRNHLTHVEQMEKKKARVSETAMIELLSSK